MAASEQVLPVFVLDQRLLQSSYASERRNAFLFGGLRALDGELRQRGSRLIVRKGDPAVVLPQLCAESGAIAVHCRTRCVAFCGDPRSSCGAQAASAARTLGGDLHAATGSVLKDDGDPYTVFTPFSKRWKAAGPLGH